VIRLRPLQEKILGERNQSLVLKPECLNRAVMFWESRWPHPVIGGDWLGCLLLSAGALSYGYVNGYLLSFAKTRSCLVMKWKVRTISLARSSLQHSG